MATSTVKSAVNEGSLGAWSGLGQTGAVERIGVAGCNAWAKRGLLQARRRRVDGLFLTNRRLLLGFLFGTRAGRGRSRRQRNRFATARRFEHRLDDPKIVDRFLRGGLRGAVLENAAGKIHQLRGELVALAETPITGLLVDGQVMLQPLGIVIGRLDPQIPFGSGNAIARNGSAAVSDREVSHTMVGELQNCRSRIVHV